MIIGIGNDLCDCRRIEAALHRHGQRFLNRIFTAAEQERAFTRSHPVATLAKIFCAKEAVVKALGTGMTKGIQWRDIEITRKSHTPPQVLLYNHAAQEFQKRLPEGTKGHIYLSLTDEWPYAQAFVILSATT